MCDCYSGKCEKCGCKMEIHIADFCTPRENVHPYCTRCTRKIKKKGIPLKTQKVFEDVVTRVTSNIEQVEGGHIGDPVIFLCDDPRAYGIGLN